jgi:hypothetical protein
VAVTLDHGDDVLQEATQLLRQHTDAGWTAISAGVLQRAMRAFRPSAPVRGRHDHGDFFVATTVLVDRLRRSIEAVPGAAASRITCTTDDQDQLETVTIEIVAAYGKHLLTLATDVHDAAAAALSGELGGLAPAADAIRTHVHIGDISEDPLN